MEGSMPSTGSSGAAARVRAHLVIANQTLESEALTRAIQDRAATGPCEFRLVVPATPVNDLAGRSVPLTPMPVMGGVLSVPGDPDEARALAARKLERALERLRATGVPVDGAVGDADPMRAAAEAIRQRRFDEVIVSTLPQRRSRWLRQDLPRRLERALGLPVTHVEAAEPPAA